jgi:hypothetical protein
MAYSKSFETSEDIFSKEVVKRFQELGRITDGAELLDAALNNEAINWIFLEGSDYEESKQKLYAAYAKPLDGFTPTPKSLARALIKLQQREARKAGIYGKVGLIGVPPRKDVEKVVDAVVEQIENPDAALEV